MVKTKHLDLFKTSIQLQLFILLGSIFSFVLWECEKYEKPLGQG